MTRRFSRSLGIMAMAVGLALSACGGSSSSSSSGGGGQTTQTSATTTTTTSTTTTPAPLSAMDPCRLITKADAQAALGGVPQMNSDPSECVCDPNGSTFKRLAIQVGDKPVSAADFAAQSNAIPGVGIAGGPAVSGAVDAAFESADHTQLVVRTGSRCFGLIVNPYDAAEPSSILATVLSRL